MAKDSRYKNPDKYEKGMKLYERGRLFGTADNRCIVLLGAGKQAGRWAINSASGQTIDIKESTLRSKWSL